MNRDAALNIAKRFITLPLAKRKLYLEKMLEENISPANLPLPSIQHLFEHIPLSFAQQRQWFLWQLEPTATAYNLGTALRLKGDLNVEALRASFETLIARHQTLRTTFRDDDEQPVQVIHAPSPFQLPVVAVEAAQASEGDQALKILVEAHAQRPFDLEQGPLVRVTLFKVDEQDHVLALVMHHIVTDGWSMPVMIDELVTLYAGYLRGEVGPLPPLPVQYADYAIWQRQWMEAGERERQLAYWAKHLGDEHPVVELPMDRPRPAIQDQAGAQVAIQVQAELALALKQLAKQQGVTLFMLLLASFQTLLHRYAGQRDIRVGVPVANRNRAETEGLIGFFVNTQVYRAEFALDTTFLQLLQRTQQSALAAQLHQDLPFEQLVEALHPERSLSHSPLFQVMYNHQTQVKGASVRLAGLTVEGVSWDTHTAQFDLTLETFEHEAGIGACLRYATALFDQGTVETLSQHWLNLLEGIVRQPSQRIADLPLLDPCEHQQIVVDWNRNTQAYPAEQCVHQLVEAQAARTPDAVALVHGEQELTYRQLNQRANQLAHLLRERGVGPDVLVGVAVERGLELVVCLLAILKAGGAYVPLDPAYPQERLAYMLKDSQAKVLLSQTSLLERLPQDTAAQTLLLDQLDLAGHGPDNLSNLSAPQNLAVSIYTSGSTGLPKGVLIEHRNIAALIGWAHSVYSPDDLNGVLASTSICFDLSVWELFVTLSAGGYAVIAQNALELPLLAAKDRVHLINTVPSAIKALHDAGQIPDSVRIINLAGEPLKQALVDNLYGLGHVQHVYDLYGPSEDTTYSTYTRREAGGQANIGRPIANSAGYVLDGTGNPLPVGGAGEFCLAGAGLARGYLGRAALTAEKFLPNPFDTSVQGGGRLYRTGDLTRYRADGVLEYVGRIDHQVKIRGFRIELGEIELKLLAHPSVREAVVIDIEGPGGRQLVGYLVADGEIEDLRGHLRTTLPDYMVPAHLVYLAALPLTPNGKLDRKALPAPDVSVQQQAYVAPQTELEQQIAAIWADVLKVEQVGLTDNFFELGGHSLLVAQVVSRVRKLLGIDIPLRGLFETPVLEGFVRQAEQGGIADNTAIVVADRRQPLVLSYGQHRQWFLWQLQPQSAAYHIPVALKLEGLLDIQALQASVQALIARHETLRTVFRLHEDQAIQIVQPASAFVLDIDALGPTSGAMGEGSLKHRIEAEIKRPFDLENGPLLRVKLLCMAPDEHVLVLTMHHIVSDGWSMPIMVDELVRLYEGHVLGQTTHLPHLPIQYADYAQWQRQRMDAGERERQLAYWTAQLGDEHPVLELPFDRPRPPTQSYEGADVAVEVDKALALALKQLARQQGVTLFMLLLASFQTLLHRYSGQGEVRVGVPVANRTRAETEGLIGFFVNTQVLKAEFAPDQTFEQTMQQARQAALAAQAHQDLPFEQLVEALHLERTLSHTPLFQAMYNHQAQTKGSRRELPGLTVHGVEWGRGVTQFDLTLNTSEHEAGIAASFNYSTTLFDAGTIERLAGHWLNVLQSIVRHPTQRVAELPLLAADELQQMLVDWNSTHADFPAEQCVHPLIEAQVARTPDATAVLFGDQALTYRQLNQRANQLAHKLRGQGVGPDVLVGLAADRSVEMVIGLLAILKAGGAYVPLDPEYPSERLAYMMTDSGIALLLTQAHLLPQLPVPAGVDTLILAPCADYSDANPVNHAQPGNLAYVIYTSGSTGKPKGAGNSHRALVNRLCWMQKAYGLDGSDTVLQKTPFSFDVSVWEFFWPLLSGARLAVAQPGDHRDPERLVQVINQHAVTTLHFVPSMLQAFMGSDQVERCASLKRVVCSGEALPAELAQQTLARLPGAGLYNLYGPTEAAIDVTHWTCQPGADSVPIGRPIDNLKTHILGAGLHSVARRTGGELYLGGVGLARGYHQRPALTAERFVPDPHDTSAQGGGRLYRTGDLARYRNDGVIEYLGRLDHQVKIRGLRIELGEIAARLLEHPAVREAVVIDIDGPGGKQLAAYLVAPDTTDLHSELREHLKASLPDYMVPTHLLSLESLPVTANGKLDRKALPLPDASQAQQVYVAPQNQVEQQLAAIWAQVLKLEQVGVHDNFFALGGDSIISIQVVSRARQIGIRLTPKELFQHQTIHDLALVAKLGDVGGLTHDQRPVTGRALLLPMQRYFLDLPVAQRHHWNQAILLRASRPLNPDALDQALQALVEHHDALRLTFTQTDGQWAAEYGSTALQEGLLRQVTVVDDQSLEALCTQTQASLNLQHGPLLRAMLATLADGSQRLLLAIHHLVVDGVSWRILLEDLQSAYQQQAAGQAIKLPAKTSSTQAWAEHLQLYARSEALQQELAYWQSQLAGASADLPCDNPHGSLQGTHAGSAQTRLDATLTRQLLQQAPAAYRTQVNDLLLTALARVIARWTGRDEVLVQLEGHGREELFDSVDLTRTVGWFTSLFPVKLSAASSLDASIKQIKEQLRAIPNKGIGYGALRYLGGQPALAALPTPRITFNYLGQFDASFGDASHDSESTWLAPALESAGATQSAEAPLDNWLSINGKVYGGELSLHWTFSRDMFSEQTMQRLAAAYTLELKAVIGHCVDPAHWAMTPSDFPLAELDQAQLDALPVPAAQVEDIYPLSPMQQGMLYHCLQDSEANLYINQISAPVTGLDTARFQVAWTRVIEQHAILRTSFHSAAPLRDPVQLVHRRAALDMQVLDWSAQQDIDERIERLAQEECQRGFDLAQAPLMRLTLVELPGGQQHLIWTTHHLLMDGWSASRLIGEVLALYAGADVDPVPCRYRDYIAWLQRQDAGAGEAFWRAKLADMDGSTLLAEALVKPVQPSPGHAALYLEWNEARTHALIDFAQRLKVTPNTLIQAVWLLLLQRYTGQETVCFGATVAGRPADVFGADKLLGLFINTVPIIQTPEAQQTVREWLLALQTYNLEARDFEHTSLADIQRWGGQPGQALFDSIIVFENYPVDERLQQQVGGGVTFGKAQTRDVTNYPMDLAVRLGSTLNIEFLYLRHAFSEAMVAAIVESFDTLLQGLLRSPDTCVGNLGVSVMPAARLASLPVQRPLLPQLLADTARRHPDAPAVTCAGQTLSYGELERRANRLAHHLLAHGVGQESRVGVALERSVETLVAFYAVLKAGAAYVPLDIDYPKERLAWIIGDSGMALLLTQSKVRERVAAVGSAHVMELDTLAFTDQPDSAPPMALSADNLAYLIYTSGSTGQPKGVAVGHGPLSMHCQAIVQRYEMDHDTRELLFMSFAFDGAQERWLSTLLSGGHLVMRDGLLWTAEQTYQALHAHAITIACFPPAYLHQLAEHAATVQQTPPAVRIYCFGGDAVAQATFEQVKRCLQPQYLTNGYGPTETVVTPLLWKVDREQGCDAPIAPIGEAVGARELYVLDAQLNVLPDGVAGELYIGGEGLARGYHQRAGLSAERFIASPFSQGGRLYRTGDLVRRRSDGVFDYLGRLDHQVKIRGFRIELGEIEARLRKQADVRDAVVVVRGEGDGKRLVAYVTVQGQAQRLGEVLRDALRSSLPDYMVPAQVMVLDALPLSPNGKLDRRALPDPDTREALACYVAPRNLLEEQLAQIWADVLGVARIGVTDNFFERGGDSLRSLKVVAKVRGLAHPGFELKLRDLIARPTIAQLSGYDEAAQGLLNPVLLLNHQVPGARPLFCIHAGFGTVFDYEPLARRLEGQRSVYGLQCRMLLDPEWQDESLPAMAMDYAQYIRQVQPEGPYRLLGWSLGGLLAALVAKELEQQAQEVEFLALVDSFIPVPHAPAPAGPCAWHGDLLAFAAAVLGDAPLSLPSCLLNEQQTPPLDRLAAFFTDLQATHAATGRNADHRYAAQDLAQAFLVGMRLKALSAQPVALPHLKGAPRFFWASARKLPEHERFEAALSASLKSLCIDTDHYSILKHETLLRAMPSSAERLTFTS